MSIQRSLELYERLKQLAPSQFDEVVLRVGANEAHLPPRGSEAASRALALVRMMGDDLDELERAIEAAGAKVPSATTVAAPEVTLPRDAGWVRALVSALLRLPVASSFQGRSALLLGIPAARSLARDENNARVDLMLLVSGLQMIGGRAVDTLIENAVGFVEGTELARELEALRASAATPREPPAPPHAETRLARTTASVDLARLREALVRLYPDTRSARRVASDSGLPLARIDFNGTAENVWFAALEEADRHGRLYDLVSVALADYPTNSTLREARAQLYKVT